MIHNHPSQILSPALTQAALVQTPMAVPRESLSLCTHQRHTGRCNGDLGAHLMLILLEYAAQIRAASIHPIAQIPIPHHHR
jgi:hypothetical protein